MAEDDEAADRIVADGKADAPARSPSLHGWTPEVAHMAAVVDRLGEVIAGLVALSGGRPPKVKPVPRPVTAIDRARQRRSRARYGELVAEVQEAQERAKKRQGGTP